MKNKPSNNQAKRKKKADRFFYETGLTAKRIVKAAEDNDTTVDKLHNLTDRAINDANVFYPYKTACGKGCHWCCYLKVEATADELFRIASYLKKNLTEEELTKLKDKLRTKTGTRCSLLSDDGSCSVYSVRPLLCRSHSSFSEEKCRVGLTIQHTNMVHKAAGALVREGIIGGYMERGLDIRSFELTSGLLRVLENPDLQERWEKGERIMDDLVTLTDEELQFSKTIEQGNKIRASGYDGALNYFNELAKSNGFKIVDD